jgi:hypothetical protein
VRSVGSYDLSETSLSTVMISYKIWLGIDIVKLSINKTEVETDIVERSV